MKLARGFVWALLGLVGGGAVLLLALLLVLRTSIAQEKVASIVGAQLKKTLAGQLTLGKISVSGALELCARALELKDPDGVPAARAKSICVSLDPLALLHKEVRLRSVALEEPSVFLTSETDAKGEKTTSLQRAVAPRVPSATEPTSTAPLAWSITVDALNIQNGSFEIRDAPGAEPRLAVHGLQLGDTTARFAQSGAAAKLSLSGALKMKGEEKAQVSLEAQLEGAMTSGNLTLRALDAHLGSSTFQADGTFALATLAGSVHVHALVIEPADLDGLLGELPLAAELRGEASVVSDGKQVRAKVLVQTERGGHIGLDADCTLQEPPRWNLKLETKNVDPAFVVRGGPEGKVSLVLALQGKGLPKFDEQGLEGDVRGTLRLGPASLVATGPLVAAAEFSLLGRAALVKELVADALAVHVRGSGVASLTELGLELKIDANDLGRFSRALGALEHRPPLALSGSAHLTAHVTGSPKNPDAQLHLNSPALALGAGLRVAGLAIDGALKGPLLRPHGTLNIASTSMQIGGIGLGAPAIIAQVDWPKAHLQIDAAVGRARGDATQKEGAIHLAGDAQVDEDGDGAELTGFAITWPGNELKQERLTRLHLRANETVLEPLVLNGARGGITFAATVKPAPPPKPREEPGPPRIDAELSLEKFELAGLPAFVLPPDLHLGGSIDARAKFTGTTRAPNLQAVLSLHAVEVQHLRGLDGEFAAQLENDRVAAQGKLSGIGGATLSLRANVPIEMSAAGTAPLDLDLSFGPLDLAKVPDLVQRQELFLAAPAGLVSLHVTAQGTLDKPRAQAVLEATDLRWSHFHELGLRADLSAEEGRAKLDTRLSIGKSIAATLTAEAPFDLTATLRKPALFAHVFDRPASAKLRVPALQLAQLAEAGIAPTGSTGELTAALDISGTQINPQLSLTAAAKALCVGALHDLDVTLGLTAAQKLHLEVEAKPGGEARAKLDLEAQISAAEMLDLARKGAPKESLEPLFARALSLSIDVEKLVLGSFAAQGTAQLPLRGELDGRIAGSGTLDAPVLKGTLTLREIEAGMHQLGDAEVYVEADKNGALAHLGLAPPSGAELAARALELAKKQAGADESASAATLADNVDTQPIGAQTIDTPTVDVQTDLADAGAAPGAQKPAAKGLAEKEPTRKKPGAKAEGKAAQAAPRAPSGMTQRGGGTFLGHATLHAPLSARVLVEQGMDAIEEGSLDGSVTMRNLDLTFLSGLTPLLRSTGGVIDGEVELHGLLGRPEPKGELHLRGGRFDVVGQGIFDDVSLDATLAEQEIVLDRVTGSTGGGTFSGKLVLDRHIAASDDDDDQYQFTGELHAGDAESVRDRKDADGKPLVARPVPLRQAGEVRGDLAAEVNFSGDDTSGNVTATVKIPSAKVRIASLPDKKLPSLSPNPEVFVFKKGEEPHPAGIDTAELKRQKAAIAASNLRVDLKLDLEKLQVSANDFEFPVTSKMHASWDAQHPDEASADGTVEVTGGTFSALGRRFSIDEAKITETGGDIADPELEIQARYENAQASVLVRVTGTAKDPQLELSSSPPMDQDAIAFFLATGRMQGQATQQGSDVDLGSAATSVLGAILFGKLRSNMADILPVDVVDIEAGAGDRPPQASVGKYIGDRIFVGYRQRFSPAPTENENELTVEYEITRGVGASSTVGDKNQGVLVTYTKDF